MLRSFIIKANRIFYLYLFFLLLSLIGNAAADFAFLWLGASLIDSNSLGIELITSFYIGQSIGYIFLAPYLSSITQKLPSRTTAFLIDSIYIILYFLLIVLYKFNSLNFVSMFSITILMAGLSSVHRNGITFSLLNQLSQRIEIKTLIEKFTYVFNITLLFGSALSGVLFYNFGFTGCILMAIISFIPMFAIYMHVFKANKNINTTNNEKTKLKAPKFLEGIKVLISHKNLLYSSIATAFAYIPGAIYPGLIAFYAKSYGVTDDISSYAISLGILVGTLFIYFLSRIINKFQYNKILSMAFIPTILTLILTLIFNNNFYIFALSFTMNCIGFSTVNFVTVMLRVKSVKKEKISLVNTAYYGVMCLGQMVGTFTLFPIINSHPKESIIIIIVSYSIASIIFKTKCSNRKIINLLRLTT